MNVLQHQDPEEEQVDLNAPLGEKRRDNNGGYNRPTNKHNR
jgi:hypothetical protein